ncbi:hypothetical protein [Aeoliella sp.]|uniref:hypothetical protein n=1 Tax=Aeoliella sp. TaxID=2795800 RepID=UPI003CCB9C32
MKRASLVLVCGLLLMAVGCGGGGPKRVPVSGRVTIDGKPLKYGRIFVFPQGVRASQGILDADGRFELMAYKQGDGVALGTHVVTIDAGEILSETDTKWHAPKKYLDPATSELSMVVEGPAADIEISLSWEGGKPFVETL